MAVMVRAKLCERVSMNKAKAKKQSSIKATKQDERKKNWKEAGHKDGKMVIYLIYLSAAAAATTDAV